MNKGKMMQEGIAIRDFRKTDLDKVADIIRKSYEEPTNISLRSKEELQALLSEFRDFIIAEADGSVVGFLTTFNHTSNYSSPWFDRTVNLAKQRKWRSYLYIDTCAVSADFRRKGIMLKLVGTLLDRHRNDYDAITFDVRYNPPNIPMLKYAKRQNCSKAEEFKAPNGSTYALFIFPKITLGA